MLRQQSISVGAPLAQTGLRQQRRAPTLKGVVGAAQQRPLSVGAPLAHRGSAALRFRSACSPLAHVGGAVAQIAEQHRGRGRRKVNAMHIVRNDDPEPTAAERLAMDICELREDIDNLHIRLGLLPPRSPEEMTKERARRWKQVLALVQAAVK
jgi:hypothetical protein